ncbi:MAG: beta-galactosidase trimerization domain-containing protein [Terriglobia bacterium]
MDWPSQAYRRFSVDMHVPDWDEALLGEFDAAQFVKNMAEAGAQSVMQYTKSHVGLCLWQTKLGKMHASLKGRDFFGEVVSECRRRGIAPLAYLSVIFDNWAYENHPGWRILPAEGQSGQLKGRYGVVCPNSPYREYAAACVAEITSKYDIDGFFCDMTFWPAVCYCPHCTERFRHEVGMELPRVVNWDDTAWRQFQKARQKWLLEFAQLLTDSAKRNRPKITVNHQFSTIFFNWTLGVPLELASACDYVGGDFYGGPSQHSLACKIYDGLTRTHPFEFHTSRTRDFHDHVTAKPMGELRIESLVATLHSAALLLVDYINANGTLNPEVYQFMGKLSRERARYEPFLGGNLQADVAIYFDKESLYNPVEQNVLVSELKDADNCPHREAVVGLARALREAHFPFGVVTNANLDTLDRYRAVLVPNVLEMTEDQAEKFRRFVESGGSLYVSGTSSLNRLAQAGPRFLLESVMGVSYEGQIGSRLVTYLTPADKAIATAISPQDHLSYSGEMIRAKAIGNAQVLAWVTLPFVDPEVGKVIGGHFAAIHSNPPALKPTQYPALVWNKYGKGQTIWVAAPIERRNEATNKKLIDTLLRRILIPPYAFEIESFPWVEMTLFDQPTKSRLLAGLLNLQEQFPQAPVPATVRVRTPAGRRIERVRTVPQEQEVSFRVNGSYVEFQVQPFESLMMYTLHYA